MKRICAFLITFRLFSTMNPSWVYVDNEKVHYLFEKRGNNLTQGGISIKSYNLPYTDSVVVSVKGREHTYRGEISIYVDRLGKLNIINRIKLEDAVKSIIPTIPVGEKNGELVKLKSVIARTILLYLSLKKKIIPDSTEFFVYRGRDTETPIGNFASRFTNGMILTEKDTLIIPFYHINSGGITESGRDEGCFYPYLVPVIDTFAKHGKHFEWESVITKDSLKKLLGITELIPFNFTSSGRVLSFKDENGNIVPKSRVQKVLNLPSLLVSIDDRNDTIYIFGRGKGNGLGISLESADYMTSSGMSYFDVINFFFQGKVKIIRRVNNEELYRIPLVQYPKETGTCSYNR